MRVFYVRRVRLSKFYREQQIVFLQHLINSHFWARIENIRNLYNSLNLYTFNFLAEKFVHVYKSTNERVCRKRCFIYRFSYCKLIYRDKTKIWRKTLAHKYNTPNASVSLISQYINIYELDRRWSL